VYFKFFTKWKTGNQPKIHLAHLLTDEREYIYNSFVVVLIRKKIKKLSLKTFTYIIC